MTHFTTQTEVQRMLLIVADSEKFHEAVLGVTRLESAHEIGAFYQRNASVLVVRRDAESKRKRSGKDRDRERKGSGRRERRTHALSDVPLMASAS